MSSGTWSGRSARPYSALETALAVLVGSSPELVILPAVVVGLGRRIDVGLRIAAVWPAAFGPLAAFVPVANPPSC